MKEIDEHREKFAEEAERKYGKTDAYIGDSRFTKNIDIHGKGLAQFMSNAIKKYCNQ